MREAFENNTDPDDDPLKRDSSPKNFSLSSSRRRKFNTMAKPTSTDMNSENKISIVSTKENPPSNGSTRSTLGKVGQKSLSVEKSKYLRNYKSIEQFSVQRTIYTPKGDSIGKFLQDARKETFFSTNRAIGFPSIKSPKTDKKLSTQL